MSTTYFHNVNTIKELKEQYKKLAFQHHPDRGGDPEIMKIINSEYAELIKKVTKNEENSAYEASNLKEYKEVIDKIINFANITIEIVGSWIWVSGETKPIKDQLNELDFKWNRKRGLWQRKPAEEQYKKSRASKKSDAEIKSFYGCETVKGTPYKPVLS
jgi:curved DNA-binding protein CbpA